MATSLNDVLDINRLLVELRLPDTVDTRQRLSYLRSDAADLVASESGVPWVDETQWYPLHYGDGNHQWIATGTSYTDYLLDVRANAAVSLEAVGFWPINDPATGTPPNTLTGCEMTRHPRARGWVRISPPTGGWPTSGTVGVRLTRGWRADQHAANSLVRALVLWVRELHSGYREIPDTHPIWTFIGHAKPLAYPRVV